MIPLSIPHLAGNEMQYVRECIETGWISSAGSYVTRFEEVVAEYAGAARGVACMNGTSGLHLCMRVLGIGPGDVVLVPNLTFVATLNAITYTGATPVLIDVDENNWQMDLDLLAAFLDRETGNRDGQCMHTSTGHIVKAIMPVHVLGNLCDMERLMEIASRHSLKVIEDSTESLGSNWNGKHAGTFGDMGVFSFNGNKIISTGGGGVIVTDNEEWAVKANHLSTQAKTSPEEYIHDEVGYNYRLVNVLAAIGVAQMEQLPGFVDRKRQIDGYYRERLDGVGDIRFQQVEPAAGPNCWLFTFRTGRMRELLRYLNDNGVQSRPFWMPMNQLKMYSGLQYVSENDIAKEIYATAISIPSSSGLTDAELQTVADTIRQFYHQ